MALESLNLDLKRKEPDAFETSCDKEKKLKCTENEKSLMIAKEHGKAVDLRIKCLVEKCGENGLKATTEADIGKKMKQEIKDCKELQAKIKNKEKWLKAKVAKEPMEKDLVRAKEFRECSWTMVVESLPAWRLKAMRG